ncbi:MAG: SRPBCC domain-containing protein [Hyphomonadaceae bacterium]|nr:SRPBCC domain-containing protein [Hyphomonadaceae bacterium]
MADAPAKKRNKLHVEVPPGQPIIIMKREFDFPRNLVWDVYTDSSHMKNWWGPHKYDTVVHEFDFRNGGKWRVDNVSKDGKEVHPFKGEFSNIRPKEEFTWTFGYADMPPGTETYRFVDLNGRTRIESVSHFPDVATRDAIAESGMEEGARETYERLEALLGKLSKAK